jgi:hypothetical protein
VFTVDNYLRFIVASNSSWMVPAGEGERRYCVLDVSDIHKEDTEFFGAVVNQMENGGYEAMLYDLLNYDLSEVNINKFPKTQALLDQIIRNMEAFNQFWYWVLDHDNYNEVYIAKECIDEYNSREQYHYLLVSPKFNDEKRLYTRRENLQEFFDKFCKEKGIKYRHIDFTSDLKRVLHKEKINKSWRIEEKGKPVNVYPIPPLDEARRLFEEYVLCRRVDHWHMSPWVDQGSYDQFVEERLEEEKRTIEPWEVEDPEDITMDVLAMEGYTLVPDDVADKIINSRKQTQEIPFDPCQENSQELI